MGDLVVDSTFLAAGGRVVGADRIGRWDRSSLVGRWVGGRRGGPGEGGC